MPNTRTGPDYNDEKGRKNTYRHEKGHCPPGFKWDEGKQQCVQRGVGPEFRP